MNKDERKEIINHFIKFFIYDLKQSCNHYLYTDSEVYNTLNNYIEDVEYDLNRFLKTYIEDEHYNFSPFTEIKENK